MDTLLKRTFSMAPTVPLLKGFACVGPQKEPPRIKLY